MADTIHQHGEALADNVEAAGAKAGETARDFGAKADEAIDRAAAKGGAAIRRTARRGAYAYDDAADEIDGRVASIEDSIRRNPLAAAGAALVIGVFLGRFVL